MSRNRLNLDDFPDSVYAQELRRGLAHLRFAAPLEAEYHAVHLQRVRLRVRVCLPVALVLAVFFTIEQVRRTGLWNLNSVAHMGALLPCTAALVWLAWSRQYERFYAPVAGVLVPVVGTLIAAFIAVQIAVGQEEQLAALTAILVGVFFFGGLMFRQAILTSASMIIGFAFVARAVNLPHTIFLRSMLITTLTSGIAAIVYWDIEQSYRRNFLEGALVSELAARDGLTGLMNRRAFDEHVLRVWRLALRDQRLIAVLMIDIDYFKRYNDDFGHQAGDLALRSVARVIQGFVRRPLDLAARYGGEEFAVILYDLTLPHVRDIAERLCAAVQNLRIKPHEVGVTTEPEITVSVGVGLAAPIIGRSPQGAIQLADEALYEAKLAGRNRVIVKGTEDYILLDTGAFATARRSRRR